MTDRQLAKQIIATLEDEGFCGECPCCGDDLLLRECGLFYHDDFSREGREIYNQYWADLEERKQELRERKKQISSSSEIQAHVTNVGFILEQLAPCLSTFRFACSDCRSIFDPIDYVIFEGLCDKGLVSRIIFADIKTGRARLSQRQREIRELVAKKQVDFDVYEPTR
jgi:predicted Holliday junction resolvase-like endonuclease